MGLRAAYRIQWPHRTLHSGYSSSHCGLSYPLIPPIGVLQAHLEHGTLAEDRHC